MIGSKVKVILLNRPIMVKLNWQGSVPEARATGLLQYSTVGSSPVELSMQVITWEGAIQDSKQHNHPPQPELYHKKQAR